MLMHQMAIEQVIAGKQEMEMESFDLVLLYIQRDGSCNTTKNFFFFQFVKSEQITVYLFNHFLLSIFTVSSPMELLIPLVLSAEWLPGPGMSREKHDG